MIKNYLKIILRNFLKYKMYGIINIAGLAIGIACSFAIYLYIQEELSYDKFHPNVDRLFKVVDRFTFSGTSVNSEVISAPMGPAMALTFPEVEKQVRLLKTTGTFYLNVENIVESQRVLIADSTFFDVFGFELSSGDSKNVLNAPGKAVLTKSFASKLFGNQNPSGRIVKTNILGGSELTVSGIAEDPPSNSHIQFDILISHVTLNSIVPTLTNWLVYGNHTYVLLNNPVQKGSVNKKLHPLVAANIGEDLASKYSHHLVPVASIHLGISRRGQLEPGGSMIYIYTFSFVAVLIMIIACANFMNLSTAQAMKRAKEIGIRKVLGSLRKQLVFQFLSEAVIISVIATAFALVLLFFSIDLFNSIAQKNFSFSSYLNSNMLPVVLLFPFPLGIAAGLYPAFFLSNFQPVKTIRGETTSSIGGRIIRKAMVTVQFVISTALIVSIAIVNEQLDFFRSKNLGFDKEQIIVIPFGSAEVNQKREVLKNAFKSNTNVLNAATSSSVPGKNIGYGPFRFEGGDLDDNAIFHNLIVDFDFRETLGLQMAAGRFFSRNFPTDSTAFVLNEAAVKAFGISSPESAISRRLEMGSASPGITISKAGPIIGVVKDFNYKSLHNAIEPIVLQIQKNGYGFFSVKVSSENLPVSIENLEKTFKSFAPGQNFAYTFLDEDFNNLYNSEENLSKVFTLFTALAVIIACLGLFGLASYTTEIKTKEIGIRKVLGASSSDIVRSLLFDFLKLILIAFIIAAPVAYYSLNEWLNNFAYRIDPGVSVFIISGLVVAAIVILTVSYRTLKAAVANPINSIRHE